MAQEVNNTVQNDNTINWDYFVQQLEKINVLQTRVNFSDNRLDASQYQIQTLKQFVGFDQDQNKNNVIENQVSGTLTTNQKKRYEEIGKQFVQGAGKQFNKIKKAIELKQKMQTKTNDFTKQVEKAKDNSKKIAKKSGFWKKLLIIIAILGMIGILFRDKIAKLLPDMSGGISNIGEKIYDFFSQLITGVVSYSSTLLGGTLTGIIGFICHTILPSTLGVFFNETLPSALVVATLSVMSLFSESSEQQLGGYLDSQAQAHGESVANNATKQMQDQLANKRLNASYYQLQLFNIKNKTLGELTFMLGDVADNMWHKALAAKDYSQTAYAQLEALAKLSNGQLLASDSFSINALLRAINEISTSNDTQENKRKRIKSVISTHLGGAGYNVKPEGITDEVANKMLGLSQNVIGSDPYQAIEHERQARLAALDSAASEAANAVPVETRSGIVNLREINVDQILINKFNQQVGEVLTSLDSFLNGQSEITLLNGVNSYFQKLNEKTQKYFTTVVDLISSVALSSMMFTIPDVEISTGSVNSNSRWSITTGDNSTNLIINVDIDDVFLRQFASIDEISKKQAEIIDTIDASNNVLLQINAFLSSGLTITGIDQGLVNTKIQTANQIMGKNFQQKINEVQGRVGALQDKEAEKNSDTNNDPNAVNDPNAG